MKNKGILFTNLTDKQKTLLSNMSYLDINIDTYLEVKNIKEIIVADLIDLLNNKDKVYLGKFTKPITGMNVTSRDFVMQLEKEGLGNLKIKDISENLQTGFNAIAFSDSNANVGISIRGTDVTNLGSFTKDVLTDVEEIIKGDNNQAKDAKEFFRKNKTNSRKNFLYGHSLGGNLVEHVYLENYIDIDTAFVINALPINEELLNTKARFNAFNNSEKFECVIIGGDWASELGNYNKYLRNIKFVKNNKELNNNMFSYHLIQSATYDKYGNFILAKSKEKAYEGNKTLVNIAKNIYYKGKKFFGNIKQKIKLLYDKAKNKILLGKNKNLLLEESFIHNEDDKKAIKVEK